MSQTTWFSGWGPLLAFFLRSLGPGHPQRYRFWPSLDVWLPLFLLSSQISPLDQERRGRRMLAAASNVPREGALGRGRDSSQTFLSDSKACGLNRETTPPLWECPNEWRDGAQKAGLSLGDPIQSWVLPGHPFPKEEGTQTCPPNPGLQTTVKKSNPVCGRALAMC